ncbi:Acyl-CoA dehydrogenase [Candidatus Kryptobacter tengchongensis]|uniref:Cyclohex-1-ene-1-carbonyl-CoA dehydrogenase n=1 Tax=Kryptobacter tengchongensis TaxID=1643429 RepID=A0A916PDL0_KRYT1|nr:acyl-CoA dehydrogenase [Candidatus Kryptobacter tengchongensis]CUS91850.1 Acyl-CoA dehydrogenase [Candidatus Kryptobacter tengchongensis]CUS95934.1 Acyl-CoA dehydrogenase [Candidatus Kryptobacter tengchongensis]CUU09390.1 Acyl-CoA dehydrogenase [Candidatus Kryptobacter tengchongensis]
MNFQFTEEQLMIKETARKFAVEELAPKASERDEKEEFPHEEIKKLAELGFMGMMTSEKYGGAGLDTISYVLAMEEISKVDASVGVIMSVNNSLVCWPIETFGTEEQKLKYLPRLARGELLGAFCLSEPEAGSDASNQRTTATRDGNFYILNGTKNFITNGVYANILIVFAQTDKEKGSKGISAFIVEKDLPGVIVTKKEKKLGIRSSDTAQIVFEDCKVPAVNRLGDEGMGFKIAMTTLNGGRIGIAAQALGIAQASLEASIKYAKERKTFGKFLAEHQAIQFKIADMATKIEAARLLTLLAAWKKDRGERYVKEASMAKLFASQIAVEAALEAVQIHGGYGYIKDFPVERYLRDSKITEIYEGTSEIQRIIIARELLEMKV